MIYYSIITYTYISAFIQLFLITYIINSNDLERKEKRKLIGISALVILGTIFELLDKILNGMHINLIEDFNVIELIIALLVIVMFARMLKIEDVHQGRNKSILIEMLFFIVSVIIIQLVGNTTEFLTISVGNLMFVLYYGTLKHETDCLTGLLNRASYEAELKKLDYETIILILDLNDFKKINDNYGHQAGDIILQKIGKVIKRTYQRVGNCYRIGGDEFAVILKRGEKLKLIRECENYDDSKVLERLKSMLQAEVNEEHKSEPLFPNVAVGGATYIPGRKSVTEAVKEAIKTADEDMYNEKMKMKQ